jgi:predicted DNA-binding transcriptional regulator YafY
MLLRGKKITARQIAEELEMNFGFTADRKTIYGDIAAINRIIPIRSYDGRGGGYCLWDVAKEAQDDL